MVARFFIDGTLIASFILNLFNAHIFGFILTVILERAKESNNNPAAPFIEEVVNNNRIEMNTFESFSTNECYICKLNYPMFAL